MDIRQLIAFCAAALLAGLVVAKCRKKEKDRIVFPCLVLSQENIISR